MWEDRELKFEEWGFMSLVICGSVDLMGDGCEGVLCFVLGAGWFKGVLFRAWRMGPG